MKEFNGKTKSGSKIHFCQSTNTSSCNDGSKGKIPYYIEVKGEIKESDLCKKCFPNGMKPTTKKEEVKMTENVEAKEMFEAIPNFIINAKDAVWDKWGKVVKAAPAQEAIQEVKAVKAQEAKPAVKAQKADGDKPAVKAQKAVPAVEAVKGVKGREARPAREASVQMYIKSKSKVIAEQLIFRMNEEGLRADNDLDIFEDDGMFVCSFTAADPKIIRAAFKAAKSKDGYNKAGLDAIAAEEKAKKEAAKAEEKAKKEAAKAAEKDQKKADKKDPAKEAAEKAAAETKAKNDALLDGEDDWPEGFED